MRHAIYDMEAHLLGCSMDPFKRKQLRAESDSRCRNRINEAKGFYDMSTTTQLRRDGYDQKTAGEIYWHFCQPNKYPYKQEWCRCHGEVKCIIHQLLDLRKRFKGWHYVGA